MFLWKDKEVNYHILKTKIRNRSVILSAVAICEPKKNRFHDRVMENYYVTSCKVNIIYCYKKGSVVHPKSQIRSKSHQRSIMGQAGQKRVKSGCMYTIYICFNSGFDQIYIQTQKLFFPNFFRFWLAIILKGVETSQFMYIWPYVASGKSGQRYWFQFHNNNIIWKKTFYQGVITYAYSLRR